MKLEVEPSGAGRHNWRLVITSTDLTRADSGLAGRLRVVGGSVRAKLDDVKAPRRGVAARHAPSPVHALALPTACSAIGLGPARSKP